MKKFLFVSIATCVFAASAIASPPGEFAGQCNKGNNPEFCDRKGGPGVSDRGPGGRGHDGEDGPGMHPGKMLHPRMIEMLGLSAEQKAKVTEFRFQQDRKMVEHKAAMQLLHLDMKQLLQKRPLDKAKSEELRKRMLKLNEDKVNHRFAEIQFLLGLLDDKQFQKLVEMMD